MTDQDVMTEQDTPEEIAYVPRQTLEREDWLPDGFRRDPDRHIFANLQKNVAFGPRPELETEPSCKQLIPYALLRHEGRVFTLRRKSAQTEERLHDKWSIGVGGHIPVEDNQSDDELLIAGMLRELREELHVPNTLTPTYRGILNDDSNDVGRVHLGLVFSQEVDDPTAISVRETEKMDGEWLPIEELFEKRERLETWSDFLLEPLESGAL